MEKLIAKFEVCKVLFNEELSTGIIIWNGIPDFEAYKEPFEALLKLSKSKEVRTVLSDITYQGVISSNTREWFEKNMLPKAIEAGMKRVAIVMSNNPLKKYYFNMIQSVIHRFGVPMKAFSSQHEAIEWIKAEELVLM
jgi:hypothetical protein